MDQNFFPCGGAASRITEGDWRKVIMKKLKTYVSWVGECALSPDGGQVWIVAWHANCLSRIFARSTFG